MSQLTNYKHKINSSLIKPLRTKKKCSSCKKIRKPSDENHQICRHCYKYYSTEPLSGNKVIDDFIKYTQRNISYSKYASMKFVPYYRFKNIEFIAEGGFSKIFKATCGLSKIFIDVQHPGSDIVVALKKLNNSKNITSKELNEVCTMLYTSN